MEKVIKRRCLIEEKKNTGYYFVLLHKLHVFGRASGGGFGNNNRGVRS